MRSSIANVAVAALALAGRVSAADADEWRTRSIYQVMIDRFALTDGSTDKKCEVSRFCGGTWKGLQNKLDYIQGMGFTAIQISPIVKNTEDHTAVGDAYHGYWVTDNYALNDRFGTEQDFTELVAEIHKRDMLLMVDVVVNNMAQGFDNTIPPEIDYSKFNPFNDKKYFHPYCNVTRWEDPEDYQNCWLYPYGVALVDLATEEKAVADELNKWVKQLVANYSIDGLRIDAAKHVNDEFLAPFVAASGVFAWGEVLSGVQNDMCRYQTLGLLPGMPNYLEYFGLVKAFNGESLEELADMRNQAASGCNDSTLLGSFSENHDMPRFAARNDDMALAKNAMAYILLNDGIPTVYQGQEQHFNGGDTPFNREPLWTSNYNTSAPLYVLTSKLNKVRSNAIKLSSTSFATERAETLWVDVNRLCLKKGENNATVVFCITNESSEAGSYETSVGGFAAGEKLVEVVRCRHTTADAVGNVTVYMGQGEPRVYVAQAALEGTGVCEETVKDGPTDSGVGRVALPGGFGSVVLAAVMGAGKVLPKPTKSHHHVLTSRGNLEICAPQDRYGCVHRPRLLLGADGSCDDHGAMTCVDFLVSQDS
ncbi:hypothetical protein VTJ49DRAFT_3160 [Mycothermus thermophilus]|uniref:alpha-amylase n=1 Tax=Humicola insolens TaxID=85995 RepID=A0ABR3V8W2_HUMIN